MPSYVAIDLKSFYASVECIERGLDPLTTNLVVADLSRTEKTICLAVSPALKAHGIPGRPRLFEVVEKVKQLNSGKRGEKFSTSGIELANDPALQVGYITATPRMALYIEYSTRIYDVYLKYVAPEDIHVYSIDEVFIDATPYLKLYQLTPHEFAMRMIQDVLRETGITATAGIGTNLYLAKIAMDIVAKHIPADKDGVRIAELDEMSYRQQLWDHRPLTDFWRVGRGYAKKLEAMGLYTMGDIARCSLGRSTDYYNEELLYKAFGVNAELLVDHAWGWEPCPMSAVKAYKPSTNSLGAGQVLQYPYTWEKARLVMREMADSLSLELAGKGLVTDQIVIDVGYDMDSLKGGGYKGPVVKDPYGRKIPKAAHGSQNLLRETASTKLIVSTTMELFDRITDNTLLVRRLNIAAAHVVEKSAAVPKEEFEQLDLFVNPSETKEREEVAMALEKEGRIQEAILGIQGKFGKNALLKGYNLLDGATARDRNKQIGGHKA
jgi:DNA polymerase V